MVARLTEAPPQDFQEVAINRDARGNYFASFPAERECANCSTDGVLACDLGIKTLATGVNAQGRIYHIGGNKGGKWYSRQLDKIRSKRDKYPAFFSPR